jgi:DNA mismatch repair protein MutS
VDVLERGDSVVFLHSVVEGGADKSYGIHVAHLAGIPREVVRAARKHLAELESQLRHASLQPDLFSSAAPPAAPAADAVREALVALEPDGMSPREALEALYALKKLAE